MNNALKRRISTALAAIALALVIPGTHADTGSDHDRARKALEAGDILPLRVILERTERVYPGQVLEVELERHEALWIYEIKILQPDGLVVKLKINARDGSVQKSSQR